MSDFSDTVKRFPTYLPSGLHTDEIAAEIEAKDQRIAELQKDLENERARGIHSCGPHCTRPLCVANRRIAELEAFIMLLTRTDHPAIKGHYQYGVTLTQENEFNAIWESAVASEDTRKESSREKA